MLLTPRSRFSSTGTFSVETMLANQRTIRYVTPWETVC